MNPYPITQCGSCLRTLTYCGFDIARRQHVFLCDYCHLRITQDETGRLGAYTIDGDVIEEPKVETWRDRPALF